MKRKGKELKKTTSVDLIYSSITSILEAARNTAYRAVNVAMVQAYGGSATSSLKKSKRVKSVRTMVAR